MNSYHLACIRYGIHRDCTINQNGRRGRDDGNLGYPVYLLTILGIWKMLGVVAMLLPGYPLVKEWAYAGFFFIMSGAIISHGANGDGAQDFFGPALLLILTIISWYFRPADRKIVSLNQIQK